MNAALRDFPSTTDVLHEDLHLNYTLLHLSTVGDCLVLGVDGTVGPAEVEEGNSTESAGLLGVGGHTPLPGQIVL